MYKVIEVGGSHGGISGEDSRGLSLGILIISNPGEEDSQLKEPRSSSQGGRNRTKTMWHSRREGQVGIDQCHCSDSVGDLIFSYRVRGRDTYT